MHGRMSQTGQALQRVTPMRAQLNHVVPVSRRRDHTPGKDFFST
jgi:hypothetical protein